MRSFLQWLKWWFIDTRRCKHVSGQWFLYDMGRNKARGCRKCGKILETLY